MLYYKHKQFMYLTGNCFDSFKIIIAQRAKVRHVKPYAGLDAHIRPSTVLLGSVL